MSEKNDKLGKVRKEIDLIDLEILALFERRMDCVLDISALKKNGNLAIQDISREEYILKKIEATCEPSLAFYAVRLFKEIFSISRDFQKNNI